MQGLLGSVKSSTLFVKASVARMAPGKHQDLMHRILADIELLRPPERCAC